MANLQSLLSPLAGLAPQQNTASAALSAVTSVNKTHGDTGLKEEGRESGQFFSRLLDDTDLESQLLFQASVEPESPALLGGEAFELTEFSGNQFPFWGQVLPTNQQIGESLLENAPLLSQDLSEASLADSNSPMGKHPSDSGLAAEINIGSMLVDQVEANDSLIKSGQNGTALDSDEPQTGLPSLAMLTIVDGNRDDVGESITPLSLEDDVFAANPSSQASMALAETPAQLKTQRFILPDAFSSPDAGPAVLGGSQGALVAGNSSLTTIEPTISGELESASLRSAAGPQTSASFEIFSKFMIEHTRQSRGLTSDFSLSHDSLQGLQDSLIEGGDFEGLLSNAASKLSDKSLLQGQLGLPTNQSVEQLSSQSTGVSSVSLSIALSQWRADQEGSGLVSSDLGERAGLAKMGVAFGHAKWGENLGSHLSLLVAKNMDSAQIQLDPPELGPLGVRIQINQDQVSLQFTSGHAVVREALEQSSQKLQQLLSQEGLDLVDVDVSDERQLGQDASAQGQDSGSTGFGESDSAEKQTDETDSLLTHSQRVSVDDGKIDYFI